MKVILAGLMMLTAVNACSDKKQFAGGTSEAGVAANAVSANSQPLPPAVDSGASAKPSADLCVKEPDSDRVLVPWQGPIKDCFDRGKIFSFETNTCMDIAQASFTCDWPTLTAKLSEKGLLSTTLKTDASSGARLISCAQSADGNRIAVQWVKVQVQETSCQTLKTGSGITTGCYQYYPDSLPPAPAQNAEEARKRVQECMKSL